jgi:hypothetical protein
MSVVYHFTDTVHLPWIALDGELKPSANRIAGFPQDFLWATTDKRGDRTCSSSLSSGMQRAYRNGVVQLVRFTLDATDFDYWPSAARESSEWSNHHIASLEKYARSIGVDPQVWRCRALPLPLHCVIGVHTKGWSDANWLPRHHLSTKYSAIAYSDAGELMSCFVIDGQAYCSTKTVRPHGGNAYANICRLTLKQPEMYENLL